MEVDANVESAQKTATSSTHTPANEVQPHSVDKATADKDFLASNNDDDETLSNKSLRLVVSSDDEHEERPASLSSSQNDDEPTTAALFCVKRKRYGVSRLGSEEILLGCYDESGETCLMSPEKLNKTMESSETKAPAAKRTKISPAKSAGKTSPQSAESDKSLKSKSSKSEPEIKAHIVADNNERLPSVKSSTRSSHKSPVLAREAAKPLTAQDDYYKKPFEFGWKRELVWRSTAESGKDRADVYFISPTGKKIRTRHDIPPLLEGELKLEHFCWAREALGAAPEFETVRNAKPSHRAVVATPVLATPPSPVIGKRISKPKGPKGASPPPQGWTPTRALKVNNAALNSRSTAGIILTSSPSQRQSSGGHSRSNSSTSSSSKKKYSNDIENDLKQINESIRNSLPVQPSLATLDAAFQQHQQQIGAASSSSALQTASTSSQLGKNFFANMSYAFESLLIILKYLKINERTRFASVCKLWYAAANSRSVWQTVRMKNSKVCNWEGCAEALQRGGTKHLDLRKMLFSSSRADDMWKDFSKHIGTACFLEAIDLCRCPARVVEALFLSNPKLRILNALTINDDTLDFEHIGNLSELEELRLRTCDAVVLTGYLQPIRKLTKLTQLSLTTIRSLGEKGVEVLGELTALRSLELGECGSFEDNFFKAVLPKLQQLQRLRLENGHCTNCCTLSLLEALSGLPKLTQLELVNFDIRPGFEDRLQKCLSIRKLLIIPTYISQSATTNQIVLGAVQQISSQLQVFTWGVTVELLRVTALYVDQCDESSKKEKHHFDECIPVLKPVPGAPAVEDAENEAEHSGSAATSTSMDTDNAASDVPQIEILPLDKVERILTANMPDTKFNIVKVPYHATCKQQLVE